MDVRMQCIFDLGNRCECLTVKKCKDCTFYKCKKDYVKDKDGFIIRRSEYNGNTSFSNR